MAFLQKGESELDSQRFQIPVATLQIVVSFHALADPYVIEEGGEDVIDAGYEAIEGGVDATQQTDTNMQDGDVFP